MKKVELHVHLDGSVRPSTVAEFLNLNQNEVIDKMVVTSNNNKDLTQYLTKFDLPLKIMQTKDNLKRVAYELAEDLKKDEVIYAEVRFAPQLHINNGLSFEEVVDSVLEGIKLVDGIEINLLLCMMRGASYDYNLKTIDTAEKYLGKGVVGLDLAGDENQYKTKDYKQLFVIAKEKKIPFTIHAGEADGVLSVKDAIGFGAKRIGHGIKIADDDKMLDFVKEKDVFLEVCPTSNVDTKAVSSYENHPIKKLYEKGVKVTINTDDRTVSNISLTNEYKKLKECFAFSDKDFLNMNINAIQAAFITGEEKKKYITMLKEDYYENIHGKTW